MSGDGRYAISLNAPPRCFGTPHKHGTALARIGRGVVVDPFGPLCTISNVRVAVVDVSSLSPFAATRMSLKRSWLSMESG